MKLVMDERLKHRLVGLLVVVSIAAIFVPAIVKKSNQRFEGHSVNTTSLRLPDKPPQPKVVVPSRQVVFNRTKVAHVDLAIDTPPLHAVTTISKAQRLSPPTKTTTVAQAEPMKLSQIPAIQWSPKPLPKRESKLVALNLKKTPKPTIKPLMVKNKNRVPTTSSLAVGSYAIQLGTFSEKSNAEALLTKLKKNGFEAQAIALSKGKSPSYKVLVGNVQGKDSALQLQKKLAALTSLKGFVVASNKVG